MSFGKPNESLKGGNYKKDITFKRSSMSAQLLSSDERLKRRFFDIVFSIKLWCTLGLFLRGVDCQLCLLLYFFVLKGPVTVVIKAEPKQ